MAPFPTLHRAKHPGGRPSLYRPEYCEQVVEAAREHGISLTAFAGLIGVTVESVYEWRRRHAEFSEACSRAQASRSLWWELKLGRSRKGAETQASIFALKNVAPNEWRDIKTTEHKHSVEKLTRDQLNAIAAGNSPADAGVIDAEYERVDK